MAGSVWYIGGADKRVINNTAWSAVGVTGVTTTTWDKTNGWSIAQDDLTGPQIAYLDDLNEFQVTGTDGPRPGSSVTAAPDADMTLGDILEWIDKGGSDPVNLTDAATINWNASAAKHFRVTLGGNRTIANPTWVGAPKDGKTFVLEVIQDATGSRTLAYGNKFAFGTDVASPTLTTAASKRDFLFFNYNATADKFYCTRVVKGY